MVDDESAILRGRTIFLNWRIWYAAAALGGLRTAVNRSHQSRDRARDEAWRVDTAGALAELLSIRTVELSGNFAIQSTLLDPGKSVDEVDLQFFVDGVRWALEAKCHIARDNSRYFLINDRAHSRSRQREARGYIPVLTHLGSSVAQVGTMIPLGDVDEWEVRTFGHYVDPARCLALEKFEERYLQSGLSNADLSQKSAEVTEAQIKEAFRRGERALDSVDWEVTILNNARTEVSIYQLLDVIGCGKRPLRDNTASTPSTET